jgi:hypothetical protein
MKYVRLPALLIFILTTAFPALATKPFIGVKGGLNLAQQWGKDFPDNRGLKAGFSGGLVVSLDINQNFMLQPELQYSMKGTRRDTIEANGQKFRYSHVLHYVELPVLVKFSVPVKDRVKPYFYIGPAGSVLLGAFEDRKADTRSSGLRGHVTIADSLSLTDFSILGGAAVHINTRNGAVLLDARYTLGLWNIDNTGGDIRNWCICIATGYEWKLEKEKKLW